MACRAPTRAVAPTHMTQTQTQTQTRREEKGGWTCPACEHVNAMTASECAVCQTPKNPVRKTKVVNKVGEARE